MAFKGSKWNRGGSSGGKVETRREEERDRSSGSDREDVELEFSLGIAARLYPSPSSGQTGSLIIDPGPDALIIYQVARATGDRPIKLKQEAGSEDIGT